MNSIRDRLNPTLHLEGILRTMVDNRSRLTKDVSDQLLSYFKERVFKTYIPRNIRLAEAPSHGLPVMLYDKSSRGAIAYTALADEMISKEEKK
jgi:chromosome partitioning protein